MKIPVVLSFVGVCLAWTFSWFAIKLQAVSGVAVEYSVAYRFFAASIVVFAIAKISKERIKVSISELSFLIVIGMCNCGINFILVYAASEYVISGVIAMLSPISIIMSEVVMSIYDKRIPRLKTIVGASIGIFGLYLFVYDLIHTGNGYGSRAWFGIMLILIELCIFAIGGVLVSILKKKYHTPLYSSVGYSTFFGASIALCIGLSSGSGAIFDTSWSYLLSLTYSTFISSVLAFICFYYMIDKIGTVKANYTALVYPLTAIIVSSYFEGYCYSTSSIFGVIFILLALVVEFVNWNLLLDRRKSISA